MLRRQTRLRDTGARAALVAAGVIGALVAGCSSEQARWAASATIGGSGGSGGSTATGGGGTGGGPPAATGAALWSRRGDGLGSAYSVAARDDGSLVVAGVFRDTLDFGAGPLQSAGGNDGFVASFDAEGHCTWSVGFGGPLDDGANAVAVDASGDVLVTGSFSGTAQIAGETFSSQGSYDVPLVKLDSQGALQWARSYGSPGFDVAYGVAVGASGTIALMGASAGPIDFGGGPLQGIEAAFVVVLDGNGGHRWSRLLDETTGNGVSVNESEHVLLGGDFSGTIDLGAGPITSLASTDGFVAGFDAQGSTLFSTRVGDGSSVSSYAIATSPTSDVLLGGMA